MMGWALVVTICIICAISGGRRCQKSNWLATEGRAGMWRGGHLVAEEVEPLPCPIGVLGAVAHDVAVDVDGHDERGVGGAA